MSPGWDVCGCWAGCPNGNMLKGCGAALCSMVPVDFVTSTSTPPQPVLMGGWKGNHRILSLLLLLLLLYLWWLQRALFCGCTAVCGGQLSTAALRWGCGGLWRPRGPRRRLVLAVATIMGGAGPQRAATDRRVAARPARPHRPGRLGAPQWVVEVAKRHRSPPGPSHSETRLPEAGGSGRPSRSDLGFACGLRG